MAKTNLVIVESPAKAKTIEKYLGKDFMVKASVGHVKDLPKAKLGVDVDNNFEPQYEVIAGKKKVIDELKKAAKTVENIYLAPDPDREGEAIAWHIAEELKRMKVKPAPKIMRVLFNEITKKAVNEAILHPIELNENMFEAQQARRILDRLVGYQISPLLWDKVRRGLSAGRVQSVAVRLICEREEEIRKFVTQEYWSIEIKAEGSKKPAFIAKLSKLDGTKAEIGTESESAAIVDKLKKAAFKLSEIQRKENRRFPFPPFITSKLQQEASRKLGFTAKKTMMIAQKLYEGIELADGELVGLITYMRTDSTRVSPTAIDEVRDYIKKTYGPDFVPESPNSYKSKAGAQDAHEAIRPTSMDHTPDKVKSYLERDAHRLYDLIWKRFVSSQMKPAVMDSTTFIINADKTEWRANGSIIKFPGFISVYTEGRDDDAVDEDEEGKILPLLTEGETLKVLDFMPLQHFTQPPPRYSEATLVKELEEKGIGRPSTYASILSVIQEKKYAEKNEQKKFFPTQLGEIVNQLLVAHFPNILDVQFTARMEGELDDVAEGKLKWSDAIKDFYDTFSVTLAKAKAQMKDVKRQEIPTDVKCGKCGEIMMVKFGRHGEFLACSKYPDCKGTAEFTRDEAGKIKIQVEETVDDVCEKCGKPMIIKRGRFGKFLACQGYPECKNTKSVPLGVDCPKCSSPLTSRQSKRGKVFYGCTTFPKCDFASWNKPVSRPCPQCGSNYLTESVSKTKDMEYKCPNKECGYSVIPDNPTTNT